MLTNDFGFLIIVGRKYGPDGSRMEFGKLDLLCTVKVVHGSNAYFRLHALHTLEK